VGLLGFGGLLEAWRRRFTNRRKDAENQITIPSGVFHKVIRLERSPDEMHPNSRIAKALGVTALRPCATG
jgi:hypothetical protein